MSKAQQVGRDKVVEVAYTIKDSEGTVVEHMNMPVAYLHGHDKGLFRQIEEALAGCAPGEEVSVTLTPEQAFGPRDPSLVYVDDLANVPPEYQELGKEAEFRSERGETRLFRVTDISEGKLTLDGNHVLAGKTLTFDVLVVNVRDATEEEIKQGEPDQELPFA